MYNALEEARVRMVVAGVRRAAEACCVGCGSPEVGGHAMAVMRAPLRCGGRRSWKSFTIPRP